MTEWKRQEGQETIFRTCAWSPPGCHPVGCGLQVHVKDGKVTKIEGDGCAGKVGVSRPVEVLP